MVFSSILFLVYFLPVFLLIYHFAGKKLKNAVLLIASIVFYSFGGPKFIFVILLTTAVDFYLVKWMHEATQPAKKKRWLVLSVCMNVGLLFYFKYCNFFVENVNVVLEALGIKEIHWVRIILPIGISFYTFESLTYVMDVYRGIHKPLKSFFQYQLYIILFPKLIAGPIVRYHEISDQITDRDKNDTADLKLTGFYRFVIGLGKKVFIANVMGAQADAVFALDPSGINASTAWIGALAYTFQIYFDFSGYSDMAIGIGRMTGFRFPENFNNPYTSTGITEFWRRWHITLGSWMRNYLYIPLGGNKVDSRWRLYFNLWLVFLLSGLWHGASWTFIFWGAYHGFFLVLERAGWGRMLARAGKLPAAILTFVIVTVGWVFFRSESIQSAFIFVSRMWSFSSEGNYFVYNPDFIPMLFTAFFFSWFTLPSAGKSIQKEIFNDQFTERGHVIMLILTVILLALAISGVTSAGFNPFIYYRF